MPVAAAQPQASVEWVDAPSCTPLLLAPCVVGHDLGNSSSLGDDEVNVYTLVTSASIHTETLTGLPPVHYTVDYNQTWVDHPVFVLLGAGLLFVDGALPEPLDEAIGFHSTERAMWGAVFPYRLVPLFDEDDGFGIPIFQYEPGIIERERLYPLRLWGDEPGESDAIFLIADASVKYCRAEEAVAPAACDLRRTLVPAATATLQDALPNVRMFPGVRRVTVDLEPDAEADVTAAKGSSAAPSAWERPSLTQEGTDDARPGKDPFDEDASLHLVPFAERLSAPAPAQRLASATGSSPGAPPWLLLAGLILLAPLLRLFHRITGKRALEHEHRRKLLALIEAQPGIQVSAAARSLGLSHHCTNHHLDILRRTGRVERIKAGRSVAIYPVGAVPLRHRSALVHLRRGPQAAMLALVARHPGQGLTALAALDGRRKSSVHAKLQRLVVQGLAGKTLEGAYTITPMGLEALGLIQVAPVGPAEAAPPPMIMDAPALPLAGHGPSLPAVGPP